MKENFEQNENEWKLTIGSECKQVLFRIRASIIIDTSQEGNPFEFEQTALFRRFCGWREINGLG